MTERYHVLQYQLSNFVQLNAVECGVCECAPEKRSMVYHPRSVYIVHVFEYVSIGQKSGVDHVMSSFLVCLIVEAWCV